MMYDPLWSSKIINKYRRKI